MEKVERKEKIEKDCVICLQFMAEPMCLKPFCRHAMCLRCLNKVFQENPKCPLCRTEVPKDTYKFTKIDFKY